MSVTASLTTHLTLTVGSLTGSVVKTFGSLTTPADITLTDGLIHEVRAVVEDDYGVETLWTTGDGNLDTFEFLWFMTDAAVFLELRTDMATDEYLILPVQAYVPFILAGDDAAGIDADRLDGAVLVEATDYAQVDRIRVCRDVADAAGDATVHLLLGA